MIELNRPLPQAVLTCSSRQADWLRRAPQLHRKLGRTTDLQELLAIALQFRMLSQRRAHFAKDARRMLVRWLTQAVVHPLSITAGRDYASAPQIRQVTGNLRLAGFQNRHKETDAHF